MELKFLKTHADAVLPGANNKESGTGDTGLDLTAVEDVEIQSKSDAVVPVGLTLAYITPGYWFRIEPRSGLGFKFGVQPHLGVIDNGYRGDLGVKLYNFGQDVVKIAKGDRIAQIVMYELLQPVVSFADTVDESTTRGDKGFGSSDKEQLVIKQSDDDWFYAEMYNSCPDGKVPMKVPKVDEGSPDYICVDPTESTTDGSTLEVNQVDGDDV